MGLACALLICTGGLLAAPYQLDPKQADELRPRDGLPNLFAKLQAGGPVRLAYLGGSITAANGWRPKTLAWFKARYPKAQVTEINAAISGTGSDYGACRVQSQVIDHQPDLVFLECRVNGGGGYEKQSVEGVVRQIWKANPRCDICFVYTIGQWMLPELEAGKQVGFGQVMETIANAYGIPTIDLGVDVAQQVKAGKILFKGTTAPAGQMLFSKDGVHPGDEGHNLYRDIIGRSMEKMEALGTAGPHALPTPLTANCWETCALLPVAQAVLSDGWLPVDPKTDKVYRDDFGRTQAMLHEAVKCTSAGATITVKWNGTTVGISDIPQTVPMTLEAIVDGGPPIIAVRKRTTEPRLHSRFWYLPEQKPGPHTVVFKVKDVPAGQAFYMGQLLIVGTVER